eukprot:gene7056-1262_t
MSSHIRQTTADGGAAHAAVQGTEVDHATLEPIPQTSQGEADCKGKAEISSTPLALVLKAMDVPDADPDVAVSKPEALLHPQPVPLDAVATPPECPAPPPSRNGTPSGPLSKGPMSRKDLRQLRKAQARAKVEAEAAESAAGAALPDAHANTTGARAALPGVGLVTAASGATTAAPRGPRLSKKAQAAAISSSRAEADRAARAAADRAAKAQPDRAAEARAENDVGTPSPVVTAQAENAVEAGVEGDAAADAGAGAEESLPFAHKIQLDTDTTCPHQASADVQDATRPAPVSKPPPGPPPAGAKAISGPSPGPSEARRYVVDIPESQDTTGLACQNMLTGCRVRPNIGPFPIDSDMFEGHCFMKLHTDPVPEHMASFFGNAQPGYAGGNPCTRKFEMQGVSRVIAAPRMHAHPCAVPGEAAQAGSWEETLDRFRLA